MSAIVAVAPVQPRGARQAQKPAWSRAWRGRVMHGFAHGFALMLLTAASLCILGYHPGAEDDGIYLAGIKHVLDPALYPHDLPFVTEQLRFTAFPPVVALLVTASRLPLAWVCLLLQYASLLTLFASCHAIARRCFRSAAGCWGGVGFVAVMLAMPVACTSLFLADQHLHPRLLSTDCVLLAVLALLAHRRWLAIPLLGVGMLMHPTMTAYGASFCGFLAAELRWPGWWLGRCPAPAPGMSRAAWLLPFRWLWTGPSTAWRHATAARTQLFLYRWPWYAWGAILGPIALLGWLRHIGSRNGQPVLVRLCGALLAYALFQLAIAMVALAPGMPVWFVQFEPMRFLYLVYLFGCLLGAGVFAERWLRGTAWRWALVFAPLAVCMYADQLAEFPGTAHFEWPGIAPVDPWLQTFAWIRTHTPRDAYFALDPRYVALPREDVYGFRALAERSMLADRYKDADIATLAPDIAPRWQAETAAAEPWSRFDLAGFEQLRARFGVNWVVITRPVPGLDCAWHDATISVCRIPPG